MVAGTPGSLPGVIRSMTGFGRARNVADDLEVLVEVRSVNHRFLDISIRMPKCYNCFENEIRKTISDSMDRGRVELAITRTGTKGSLIDVVLDEGLAKNYHACLSALKERFQLAGEISVSDMLTLKDMISTVEKEGIIDQEWPLLETTLRNALSDLDSMKRSEGAAMWRDMEARLESIVNSANLVAPMVNEVTLAVKDRLDRRVKELTGGMELDRDRLLQEVALLAERSDVTEELTRLKSHVEQFGVAGKEGSPLGRKLDFLLQELQREINTLGSKSASTGIAVHVVKMKAELEKIREQTQNIE